MLTVRGILHPTDFSELSNNAFQLACQMALDYHAPLHVLHVATVYEAFEKELIFKGGSGPYLSKDRAQLDNFQWPGLEIQHILKEGEPAEQIILASQSIPCDFIIMGSHGRTGLSRLLLGSVAEHVLREATCQVIIVKMPLAAAEADKKEAPASTAITELQTP